MVERLPQSQPAHAGLFIPEALGLTPVDTLARALFRGGEAAEALAAKAFGVPFPAINRASGEAEGRAALRLGPDEVLLFMPETESEAVFASLNVALAKAAHSLVDITHRQQGFRLEGPSAARILNAGCPLDLGLAAFPLGMATRSLFFKAEITLWRQGEHAFHIECGRSFVPYLVMMLENAMKTRDYP